MQTNGKAAAGAAALGNTTTVTFYYPDHETVHGQVLAAFLNGEELTTLAARPRLHTTTLTQSVQKLRRAGWPVVTERITVATADGDRQAHVGRYSLPLEAIALAGERGQQYSTECRRLAAERQAA